MILASCFWPLLVLAFAFLANAAHFRRGLTVDPHYEEMVASLMEDSSNPKDFFERNVDNTVSRIVGGTIAPTGRYPYYCDVIPFDAFQLPIGRCGGTLIAPDAVLTAGHCFLPFSVYGATISCNATVNAAVNSSGYEHFRFAKYFRWPTLYAESDNVPSHDWFLVFLTHPITTELQVVELNANTSLPTVNESLTTFGFGAQNPDPNGNSDNPLFLTEVHLDTVSFADCNGYTSHNGHVIDAYMLCAGDVTGEVRTDC